MQKGLFTKNQNRSLATLEGIDIQMQVVGGCYKAVVTQEYKNNSDSAFEIGYRLLLPSTSSIIDFEADIDGKLIKGEVKPKEEAEDDYDDAIASGSTVTLLKSNVDDMGNMFEMSLGNLVPNSKAKIKFTFANIIDVSNDRLHFSLPKEIVGHDNVPPIKSFNFEIEFLTFSMDSGKTNYGGSIENNGKSFSLMKSNVNHSETLDFSGKINSSSIRDVIIREKSPDNQSTLLIDYIPRFDGIDKELIEPHTELIFVIDRSGSMGGQSILLVRRAMNVILHAIPESCRFNIVSFGSSFSSLFEKSKEYNTETLDIAKRHCESMNADMGGTNLLKPLKSIFNEKTDIEYPRVIFILTDGCVSDRDGTINLVKQFQGECFVHVLGIGNGVDKILATGLAKNGNGECIFSTTDQIDVQSMQLFEYGSVPTFRKFKITNEQYEQFPTKAPAVRDGQRLILFGKEKEKKNRDNAKNEPIQISCEDPCGEEFTFKLKKFIDVNTDFLEKYAASQRIKELEKYKWSDKTDDEIKAEIIDLSLKYQLISSHTSYVAVSENNDVISNGNMIEQKFNVNQSNNDERAFFLQSKVTACHRKKNVKKRAKKVPKKESRKAFDSSMSSFALSNSVQFSSSDESMDFSSESMDMSIERCVPSPSLNIAPSASLNFAPSPSLNIAPAPVPQMMARVQSAPSRKRKKSSQSSSVVKTQHSNQVDSIVNSQNINGSWSLDYAISLINKSRDEIISSSPIPNNEIIWASALVYQYLFKMHSDSQDLWRAIATKAKKYIIREAKKAGADGKKVIEKAKLFLA